MANAHVHSYKKNKMSQLRDDSKKMSRVINIKHEKAHMNKSKILNPKS